MTVGLYPRQHEVYQDYLIKQIKIAKNRISHFPLLDKMVENFKGYENLRWKESRNKIFIESTIKPERFPVEIFEDLPEYRKNKNISKLKPFIFDENEGDFPHSLLDAEDAVNLLIRERWNKRQQKEFAKRLKDYDYFTSNSAYSELMTAYEFGKIVGFDNIVLNPTLSSKKNSDIFLRINDTDIFFELTEPRPKESENKIQRIFDDFAEFLGNRFGNKKYVLTIFVNTLFFPKDEEGHIDETASKRFLQQWSHKILLDKLIDSDALIQLDHEFYSVDGAKFLGDLVEKS
ncbi:MAG: hypothetical protein KGL95_06280, partial [Patescibacteria group bacterium]|nr:hypothetical protein [Patescibacteria group bacterium]